MVKIQLEIPEKENEILRRYCYKKNINDKRKAIIEIIANTQE